MEFPYVFCWGVYFSKVYNYIELTSLPPDRYIIWGEQSQPKHYYFQSSLLPPLGGTENDFPVWGEAKIFLCTVGVIDWERSKKLSSLRKRFCWGG